MRGFAAVRRLRAYQAVFKTPVGQDVLADLLRFCGVLRDPFVPGDPHTTSYNVGMRRVGLRILHVLAMTEAELMRLEQQAREEDFSHAA